jgi:hypothetical protein
MTDDPLQDLVYEAERAVWAQRMYRNVLPTPFDLIGSMQEISESSFVRNVAPVAIRALNPVLESECCLSLLLSLSSSALLVWWD